MYFNHKKTEDWHLFGEDEEGWSDFDADNKIKARKGAFKMQMVRAKGL